MRHPIPRTLSACLFGMALAGCTTIYQPGRPPVTLLDDPFGHVVVAAPPPPAVAPPLMVPASDALPAPGLSRVGVGGTYVGWATMVDAQPGACAGDMRITGFRVVRTQVRYGRYAGRIAPDGSLTMAAGTAAITGVFRGPHFQGQMSVPGRASTDGCAYLLTLDRE